MFEEQIASNKHIPKEYLDANPGKKYHSGRLVEEGDQQLFGVIWENGEPDDQGVPTINIELIAIHKDEIGVLYEEHPVNREPSRKSKFPAIKLIK